jgi:hypothetical protein
VNVLNPLVAPDPTAAATIMLFQRGGSTCEYAVPDNGVYNDFLPISDDLTPSQERYDQPCMVDELAEPIVFGAPEDGVAVANMVKMAFGERITSFRELVKRYHFYGIMSTWDGVSATQKIAKRFVGWHPNPHLPSVIKLDIVTFPNDWTGANDYMAANSWANNGTLLSYLRPAFSGWKGSIRHFANFYQNSTVQSMGPRVQRGRSDVLYQATFVESEHTDTTFNNTHGSIVDTTLAPFDPEGGGIVATNYNLNAISYEIPYYSRTFYSATSGQFYLPNDLTVRYNDGVGYNGHSINVWCAQETYWDHFVAAGDDYDLIYYIGPPYWFIDQAPAAG